MAETRFQAPALIFDGTCAFCTRSAEWVLARARGALLALPFQAPESRGYGVDRERAAREALWIDRAGRVYGGHRALEMALRASRRPWSWLGALLGVPPLRWLAAVAYRLASAMRGRLPGSTPACDRHRWDPHPRPSTPSKRTLRMNGDVSTSRSP